MATKTRKRNPKGETAAESVRGESSQIQLSVSLAPLDSTDMSYVRQWRNDYAIWQWCRQNDLISDADQSRWFERQSQDPTIRMYKITVSFQQDDKPQVIPVGVCGLTSIDSINRRAEFSLYIAPQYQGNDFGDKALRCLLTHGFKNLGLHVIWGEVFAGNPALKLFEGLGFRREGLRRDFYFRDGKFVDAYLISIKEDEWAM